MESSRTGFLILAIGALMLAAVLTWGFINPKEVNGYDTFKIGSLPNAPTKEATGVGTIFFTKTEDEKND